jgi:hypothetical protein
VAPFRLADAVTPNELDAALAQFARAQPACVLPGLVVRRIGAFYALVPGATAPAVHRLAEGAVEAFARFRSPLTEAEIARRRPETLTPIQRENLERWGYPYVFGEYRFHMTLTGPTEPDIRPALEQALKRWFAPVLARPVPVGQIACFVEDRTGAPFRVWRRHRLS